MMRSQSMGPVDELMSPLHTPEGCRVLVSRRTDTTDYRSCPILASCVSDEGLPGSYSPAPSFCPAKISRVAQLRRMSPPTTHSEGVVVTPESNRSPIELQSLSARFLHAYFLAYEVRSPSCKFE